MLFLFKNKQSLEEWGLKNCISLTEGTVQRVAVRLVQSRNSY